MDLKTAWTSSRDRLKAAGVDSPAIDARLLLEAAASVTRTDIVTDPYRQLTSDQAEQLEAYLERRSRREPVGRILGRQGFWKLMLNINSSVLAPRPDTETVLDVVLPLFGEYETFDVIDLGVGSGAILLAILAERSNARGLGVDVSFDALAVARENAANLGFAGRASLLRSDWAAGVADHSFDLVVSNPPYIASAVIDTLDPEVRHHDPRIALDGGEDGLDAYRTLAPEVMRLLRPGRHFALEIGFDQSQAVEALMRAAGAIEVRTVKDLGLRDRVVTGRSPE